MKRAGTNSNSLSTRESLLHRLKDVEDQDSWRDFFNTYWSLIYRTATYAGLPPSEAEDVVQETVVRLTKDLPNFSYDRRKGSFKSWLLQRVWWEIKMHLRTRRRIEKLISKPQNAEEAPGVEEVADACSERLEQYWERQWQQELVDAAIERIKGRISSRTYQLFDMAVNQGLRSPEVAKKMGVSTMQVYLAKHRVTRLIADEVKKLQEGRWN